MFENEERTFKIFVDFDGTITQVDVGEAIFIEFGDEAEANNIIQKWIDREISSIQTWQLLCKTITDFDKNSFDKYLDSMDIDQSFKVFVDYCRDNGFELSILSDGLDYYINRILERENLDYITKFSNRINFIDNNLIPAFDYTDEECGMCANCKRNHILSSSSDSDYTIYIGDGWSDTCPAQYCDFIFAKNSLLKFCEENRISYFPFKNFDDVMPRIEDLRKKKRLKKRHQAQLKRNEVYMQG